MVKKYLIVGAKPIKKFIDGDMESTYGNEVLVIVDKHMSLDFVSRLLVRYNIISSGILRLYNNDSELLPIELGDRSPVTTSRVSNLNPDSTLLSELTLGLSKAIVVTPYDVSIIKHLTDTTSHKHPIGKITQLVDRILDELDIPKQTVKPVTASKFMDMDK